MLATYHGSKPKWSITRTSPGTLRLTWWLGNYGGYVPRKKCAAALKSSQVIEDSSAKCNLTRLCAYEEYLGEFLDLKPS